MDKVDPSIALSSALVSISMDKGGTISSNNSCDVVVKCSSSSTSNVVVSAASCGASSTSSSNSCSHSSGDDEEEEDDDDCTRSKLHCLHCGAPTSSEVGIQVSCDECNAFLCNNCHWCHEFQANHEIRVCERCDGFFCRKCDEMDQCDSCQEVVCSGCASLLSCKFCGAGMCEECATGCGRCGIVLCERDLKFAVECDTCKLPYCLVCLASAAKEPCVRCGVRQSKRVNQVVHLRLKSIYKAFQQSSSSNNNSSTSNFIAAATTTAKLSSSSLTSSSGASATSTKKRGAAGLLPPDKNVSYGNNRSGNPLQYSNSTDYYTSSSTVGTNTNNSSDWGAFFGGDFCRPASTTNNFNNNKIPKEYSSCDTNTSVITASENTNTNINRGRYYGERARMMMSVKAACAQAAGAAKNSLLNASSNKSFKGCDCNASVAPKNAAGITAASTNANTIFENSNSSTTTPTMYDYHNLSHVAHNYSRTDAEADAAAAALLKELEEEEEAKIVQSSKKTANKSKKKKQQNKVISKAQTTSSGVASTNTKSSTVTLMADVDDKSNFAHGKSNKNAPNSPPTTNDKFSQQQQTSDKDKSSNDDEDSEHEMERTLVSFIDTSDVDGIEAFLASIKGVPGRALLRKNAKKALKRMKEENPGSGAECHLTTNNNLPFTASTNALPSSRLSYRKDDDNPDTRIGSPQPKLDASSSNQYVENSKVKKMEETAVKMASSNTASANTNAVASSNKLSLPSVSSSKAVTTAVSSNIHRPLLKVVKQTTITSNGSNSPSPFNNPNTSHSNKQNQYPGGRAECVMHMSPVIIGWVIGKGGQRIRDIMEEASARIWIDQNENNIQVDGYRVVYVSGGKKNVETAIKLLKDLISKAPINNNCNNASGNPDSNKSSSAFPPASSANLASESNKVTINKSSGSSGPVPSMSSHAITPGIAPTSAWGKAASTTTVASRPLHGGSAQAEDTGRSASMAASSAATSLLASGENNAVVAEYTQVVQCEPRFVALLIGRRGWTVKHIQDESGARVDIDQTVTPRIIRISGSSENQVTMATQMVRDVLSYPDAQLHYGDSSISNEKTIHRMLDQQKYNSALVTTAHKEQQFLLTALEHPVQGNALHAVAGAAVKANVGSLLPPLPPDAHQEQFVGDGKQQGSNSESSSSSFDRSVSWQASSSYLQHAPPPGYAPAVTASHTATTSSMPLTPDAVRLERDMRTTTQSVLAGLYSPTDDDKRNSIGTSSSNTTVDSSWPQSALANLSINKNNSFANPSPLFKVQENQNAVSHRGEHDTGTV